MTSRATNGNQRRKRANAQDNEGDKRTHTLTQDTHRANGHAPQAAAVQPAAAKRRVVRIGADD
jgi:hypothetical protein